jgi:hypothetical protein
MCSGWTTIRTRRTWRCACPYQSYKSPEVNPLCDPECRDVGMLSALQKHIDAQPRGDIFIVLHQMGNHGPAYFKRYPPEFEKFKPACQSADLSLCSREEIGNAYDNAILYTDFFLGKVIELLKMNDNKFETGAALRQRPRRIARRKWRLSARPATRHRARRAIACTRHPVARQRLQGRGFFRLAAQERHPIHA